MASSEETIAQKGDGGAEVEEGEATARLEAHAVAGTSSGSPSITTLPKSRQSTTPSPSPSPSAPQQHQQHQHQHQAAAVSIAQQMPAGRPLLPLPLLVCSIGNPGPTYANTLHSAGHTALNHLAARLGYTAFRKDRAHGNGLLSPPPASGGSGAWTLWQSTSYMNDSGKGVRAAYTAWSKSIAEGDGTCRLVVVHDELEKPLGTVSVKTNRSASAKGHNGLKSIMAIMGHTTYARIGVGIGRPASREPDDVARYVLKKMTAAEKIAIEASVESIIDKLRQLEAGG